MTRATKIAIILLIVIMLPLIGWTEEAKGMKEKDMGMRDIGMKGMISTCPEHAMMMSMMMKRTMLMTNDGGVIIMMGNKLIKFDKDLNMVKKAQIDLDIPGLEKMMKDIKEKCPMCTKLMSECQMK